VDSYGFWVTLTQPFLNCKSEFYLDYDAVVPYVETFANSLLNDTDLESCRSIQVDVPGLPSVMLAKSRLYHYLALVFDAQMDILRDTDWPLESSTNTY
jgi:hypothetical protein